MKTTDGHNLSDGSNLDPQLMSVVDEIGNRIQRGESVDAEQYAIDFPHHAVYLRQLIRTLQGVVELGVSEANAAPRSSHLNEKQIGEYRLLRQIGQGGMGIVFEAEQQSLDRRVALKVLQMAGMLDERQLTRFKNEARAAATLHHPHIVPVFAVGSDRGVHYYAMQYIDGPSLAEILHAVKHDRMQVDVAATGTESSGANLSGETRRELKAVISTKSARDPGSYVRKVARWGMQAAEALAYAHENGVLHRDIKPGNLLVDARDHLWITDFGLARIEKDVSMTMTGDLLGTIRYMSPEQALAKRVLIDHRSDIYSLGVTLYELLTFQPAFSGGDRQVLLKQIAFEEPKPLRKIDPAIPIDLETIVLKAAAKSPEERFQSAQELADDLQRFLDDMPIRAKPPTMLQLAGRWARRHQAMTSALAAILIVTSVALAVSHVLVGQANRRLVAATTELEDALEREETAADSARAAELRSGDLLYAADIRLAGEALAHLNVRETRERLARHLPSGEELDRRGFAWHYLWSQLDQDEMTLTDRGPVFDVEYSPDGKLLASSHETGEVVLRDATSGSELYEFADLNEVVRKIDFSSDGVLLAGICDDGQACVWQVEDGKLLVRLRANQPGPGDIAFHPDGTRLATVANSEVKLHELPAGRTPLPKAPPQAPELNLYGPAYAVDFSPDGRWLAIGAADDRPGHLTNGAVWVWDLNTKSVAQTYTTASKVTSLRFSHAGSLLAAGMQSGDIFLLDPNADKKTALGSDHASNVYDLTFSPDDSLLVSAGKDATARVWNISELKLQKILQGHTERVYGTAVSPGSDRIATASKDGTVKVWRMARESFARRPLRDARFVEFARFAPDRCTMVTTASHGVVIRHDLASASRKQLESLDRLWPRVGWQANGEQFILSGHVPPNHRIDRSFAAHVEMDRDGDGKLDRVAGFGSMTSHSFNSGVVWQQKLSAAGWAPPRLLDHTPVWHAKMYRVDLDADGSDEILAADYDEGVLWGDTLLVDQPATDLAFADIDHDGDLDLVVAVSQENSVTWYELVTWRDGRPIFAKRKNLTADLSGAAAVVAEDLTGDGLPEIVATGWKDENRILVFENRGKRVFSEPIVLYENYEGVELLDVADVDEDGRPDLLLATLNEVVWYPNQGAGEFGPPRNVETLVDATWTRRLPKAAVTVYNAENMRPVHRLQDVPLHVDAIAMSPDGTQLAVVDDGERILIWQLPSQQLIHTFPYMGVAVMDVMFSPDGRFLLAAVGDDLRVWSTRDFQLVHDFQQHENTVWKVAVSDDSKMAATCSEDKSVRLWSLTEERPPRALMGHESAPDRVTFSPDSRRLASAADDGTVCIWDTVTGQQLLVLRDIITADTRPSQAAASQPPLIEDIVFRDGRTLVALVRYVGHAWFLAEWRVE